MGKLTARFVQTVKDKGMHGDGHGLYLQVTPPDGKSWILRTKVHGKTKYIGIGSAHLFSLAEARDEAQRLRKIARSGSDPLAERQREVVTFEDAARRVHEAKTASWKNGKHRDNWISTLKNHAFPTIGSRPIDTLTSADILAVLMPIWHKVPETATRVRQRTSNVFDWAKAAGFYHQENPVDAIKTETLGVQTHRVKHFEAMPYQDVPKFMALLNQRDAIAARALELGILCASRAGEIRGVRWTEIDMDSRVWAIPAERMKGKKGKETEHRVPLTDAAIEVLERVRSAGQELVFPAVKRGKDGAERELSDAAVRALLKRMECTGLTQHGFRTSFRTWAQETVSAPHEVIERCLAHAVGNKVSQAYARSDQLEQRREVMEAWASYLSPAQGENIVTLADRR